MERLFRVGNQNSQRNRRDLNPLSGFVNFFAAAKQHFNFKLIFRAYEAISVHAFGEWKISPMHERENIPGV